MEVAIDLLAYIKEHPESGPTTLCRQVSVEYGRMTGLIDRMWSSCLLTTDRRHGNPIYGISPEGKKALRDYESLRRRLVG